MSAKIYNAYFTTAGIGVVMSALLRARDKLGQHNRLTQGVELAAIARAQSKAGAVAYARMITHNILSGYAVFNPSCSASVYAYPYPDEHNKRSAVIVQLHGMVYEDEKRLVRAFRGTDYHYQNQCDKPDDVSESEWNARKSVWNKVLLKRSGVPAENALGFDILSPREAVEHVLVGLRLVAPPPVELQRSEDGKPWEQWGPQRFAFYKSHDLERAAKAGKREWHAEWAKITERLLPFDNDELSLQSASL